MGGLVTENRYQAGLIKRLNERFPGCLILKNDSSYLQGIPDLTILYGKRWAMLEVKASAGAPFQPNQEYYLAWAGGMGYAAVIFPENEGEVLSELQLALAN
jgi:hypothetical protein